MLALELKLTRKVTSDREGARTPSSTSSLPLPRILVARISEVEPSMFYVLSSDIEVHGLTGGCPGLCGAGIARKSNKTTQQ